MDLSVARALELLGETTIAVKAAVRRDRVAYLQGLAGAITLQDLRRPKELFAAVRRAFPKAAARRMKFQPLPAVLMADGTFARTPEERVQRWTEFFSNQEGGRQVTASEYQEAFACPHIPVMPTGPVFDIQAVPTLGDLEQQILSTKFGKACGPDTVTAEVLRVAPAQYARLSFPLHLKAALGVREPVEWRGGVLMCLAKRAAAALSCSSFRSILLANVVAKTHHRLLRDRLVPAFRGYKTELQAGQLPGTGVDSLALLARTYQLRAQHRGMCCALTYYDVKSAFYRVIRQAFLPTPTDTLDDAGFLRLIHDLDVPPAALSELVDHLRNMTVLAEAQVSEHLQSQVADLFRGSWFRLDAGGPLVATFRGTRPGDPLADMLFAFSFAAYLRSAEQALQAAGVATYSPAEDTGPMDADGLGCIAWADDYTHLQMHQQTHGLLQKADKAELTFAPDKTAILLSSNCPRTPGPLLRQDAEGHFGLWIHDEISSRQHFLRVVDSYKHLGSITVANARNTVSLCTGTDSSQALAGAAVCGGFHTVASATHPFAFAGHFAICLLQRGLGPKRRPASSQMGAFICAALAWLVCTHQAG